MKGQVSVEYALALTILLVAFLLFSFSLFQNQFFLERELFNWRTEIDCFRVGNIVSAVYQGGPGTTLGFKDIFADTNNEIQSLVAGVVIFDLGGIQQGAADGNVAYYNCHNNELKLLPFFSEEDVTLFLKLTGNCGKSDDEQLISLTNQINNFTTVVLEDPHVNEVFVPVFESWVSAGGRLILSEHPHRDKKKTFAGVKFESNPTGTKDAFFVNIHPDFPELHATPDMNIVRFKNGKVPEIVDSSISFFEIMKYKATLNSAVVQWDFNSGSVFYFPDFDVRTFDVNGSMSDGNFAQAAAASFLQGAGFTGPLLGLTGSFCPQYAFTTDVIVIEDINLFNDEWEVVAEDFDD